MTTEATRKEVARSLAIEAIKQGGVLNKTDWTPAKIVEELDTLYKSFYDSLEEKDITK